MKALPLVPIIFTLLPFFSCNGQEVDTPQSVIYEPCCGAEPVEFTHDSAYLFVPNVFTPNSDGINDFFAPRHNAGIEGFATYLIRSVVGDTLLWASVGYDQNNIANTAWNGLLQDGSPYIGLFKYEFDVFLSSGGIYRVEGKACRIECGPDAADFKSKAGCFFPIQAGVDGRLNSSLANQEEDCFN